MNKLILALVVLTLSACGGGGGGGSAGGDSAAAFKDSFGSDVHSSGYSVGDAGMDGSAGDGAPIPNAKVTITDAAGKTVSATTDQNGIYHAKINKLVPPFLVQVLNPKTNQIRYSLGTATPVANGFIVVNLSSITSKIVSDVAVASSLSDASQIDVPFLSRNTAATLAAAIGSATTALRNQLSAVIIAAGLSPSSFDPISWPFIPNHKGYDFVLDYVSLTSPTQIAINSTFVGTAQCPFVGTYSGTISGGDSGTFTVTVDGSCLLTATGQTIGSGAFTGSGTVTPNGATALSVGGTSTGAVFTGTVANHIFSGTWSNSAAALSGSFSGS